MQYHLLVTFFYPQDKAHPANGEDLKMVWEDSIEPHLANGEDLKAVWEDWIEQMAKTTVQGEAKERHQAQVQILPVEKAKNSQLFNQFKNKRLFQITKLFVQLN